MIKNVTFNTIGRLGNNLFQYTACRLLADLLDVDFISPIKSIDYFSILKDSESTLNISNSIRDINDFEYKDIINSIESNPNYINDFKSQSFETIRCSGYFQYSNIINKYKDKVLNFFNLNHVEINTDDLVIHLRLDDFAHSRVNSGIIDYNWFIDIIKTKTYNKLYIVVDKPTMTEETEYLNKFLYLNPIFISGRAVDDFNFLRCFENIIISNSTFSWWAAFLGAAKNITLPENYNHFGVEINGFHAHQEITDIRGIGYRIPCKFINIYSKN